MSTSAPPRIVLDTNVLIASIGTTSPYRWLFEALLEERFVLCVTTPISAYWSSSISHRSRS